MNYMRKTIKSIVEDKIISEQMETHTMILHEMTQQHNDGKLTQKFYMI